ncbi:MAG: proline dehydrogenase [Chlorobi bacterium]|nr:proline dehydrogenase [Chlorobiota bacterium]
MNADMQKIKEALLQTDCAYETYSCKGLRMRLLYLSIAKHSWLVKLIEGLTVVALKLHLPISFLFKKTVFPIFCGGETIEDAKKWFEFLEKKGINAILDYAIEGKQREEAFDRALKGKLELLKAGSLYKACRYFEFKVSGIAPINILEKLSAGEKLSSQEAERWNRAIKRIDTLLNHAIKLGYTVMIDAEETWLQPAIDSLAEEFMDKYNTKQKAYVYTTIQMYLKKSPSFLEELISRFKKKGKKMGIKLVRGAYVLKERERAKDKGYPDPLWETKEQTDKAYDNAIITLAENNDVSDACIATHNLDSIALAWQIYKSKDLSPDSFWMAQLMGMADFLTCNLARNGLPVAKLVPIGPVKEAIPYLLRRLEENSGIHRQFNLELEMIKEELRRRGC